MPSSTTQPDEHSVNSGSGSNSLAPTIVCGLQNLGNTCYFNSGLQVLANAGSFVSWMMSASPFSSSESVERHSALHPMHSKSRLKLFRCTTSTLDDMANGGSLAVAPTALLQMFTELNPHFQGFHQQDCPEMITSLLSQLEDETKLDCHVSQMMTELCGGSSSVPQCTSSQRYIEMLRLMESVTQQNAEEELSQKKAKGQLTYQVEDYRPPTMTRNAVTDAFRGHMLHEITCHGCGYVSRTVDEFTSLTVEVPTKKQRIAYATKYPGAVRWDAYGTQLNANNPHHPKRQWWNPIRYIAAFFCCLVSCCGGDDPVPYALTLEECLDIYFHEETLRGSNKYRCPKCRETTEATKQHTILWHPELLVIHLKRFEVGAYWTSKRTEPVIFPLGAALPTEPEAMPSKHKEQKSRCLDMSPFSAGGLRVPAATKYELKSVVNHHGSYGGGHYTAYAHKGDEIGWVLCNDEQIRRVTEGEVADSQEYVLVYEKCNECLSTEEVRQRMRWRDRARQYLANTSSVAASGRTMESQPVFVSRAWLHRVASFVEPGPLLNRMCYCRRILSTAPIHAHGSALGYYLPISSSDYDGMVRFFGGSSNDKMDAVAYRTLLQSEMTP